MYFRANRGGTLFKSSRHIPPWFFLVILLAAHVVGNYYYARHSSLEYLINIKTIHGADYYLVFGYRFLTGPPYHLSEGDLVNCYRPSMGVGLEQSRTFSWTRVKQLIHQRIESEQKREFEGNPFFLIPAALGCTLLGPSPSVIVFTPTIYLLLLIIFTYLCGKEIRGSFSGLSAALCIGLIPWIIGLSRYGRSYICLITALSITYYFLLKTRQFSRPLFSIFFIASFQFAFFSVPSRTEFFLFIFAIIGPSVIHGTFGLIHKRHRLRTVFILVLVCLGLALIARDMGMINYVKNPYLIADHTQQIRGNIFRNPGAILAYPVHFILVQVSVLVTVLVAYPIWKYFRNYYSRRQLVHRLGLFSMFFLSFAFLTYYNKKQPIYITHLSLPIVLAAGAGMSYIRLKKTFFLVFIGITLVSLAWRSIPISSKEDPDSSPLFCPVVEVIDMILWKEACRDSVPFSKAFFHPSSLCYPIKRGVCSPSQDPEWDEPGIWKENPVLFWERMSHVDGVRIGFVCHGRAFGPMVEKGAEILALNPTITVHLFNRMRTFDLTIDDFDWIVVSPNVGGEGEEWLKAMDDLQIHPFILDEFLPYLCFSDDEQSVQRYCKFMIDIKNNAELRFVLDHSFFFATPEGWDKAHH